MKIIQICGTNGAGKTTLVKNLLANGDFERDYIEIDGKTKEYWFDGEIAVIGKYNSANCCGVDAGNYTGETLLKAIQAVAEQIEPEIIVFEDVRFGCSFAFKQKLAYFAQIGGYKYVLVNLIARLEITCERVLNRSGNVNADYDAMRGKARGVINSSRKAAACGAKVLFYDTGKNGKGDTLAFLLGVING